MFVALGLSAQPRFFKANGVRVRYEYSYSPYLVSCSNGGRHLVVMDSEVNVNPDTIVTGYATMWLGNDTIIDGYDCVVLWNMDDGEEPECVGAIREDKKGYVWRHGTTPHVNRLNRDIYDRWMLLYDFSRSDWEVGMSLEMFTGENYHVYEPVEILEVSSIVLLNGEEMPTALHRYGYTLVYGIGYLTRQHPFEGFQTTLSNLTGGNVLEYWRDDKLLYKTKEPTAVSSLPLKISNTSPFYDLLGRPVSHPTSGIYIQNGKKVWVR